MTAVINRGFHDCREKSYGADQFANQRDGANVTKSTLSYISWWNDALGFLKNTDAWDFTGLSTRYHPILRGVGGQ